MELVIAKKMCMVGLYGVGKTSLVKRYVESIFDERYHTTIGVKIDKKDVVLNGRTVSLAIWDMAGEDDIAQIRVSHLRGASGYLLIADGCRRASLEKAFELRSRIEQQLGALPFVLVVNKADLKDQWEIQASEIEQVRNDGWPVVEASARTGDAVDQAFLHLAGCMLAADRARAVSDDDE